MSKFNLDCKVAATNAMQAARTELRLFCHIMGIADNIYNHFIGDDPYGVVDFQDGFYDFSMTDIHVVVSEYEHWLELYGSNEVLARAVRQWYYWSLDWHQKHRPNEWNRISQERVEIPDPKTLNLPELDMDSKMVHKRYSKPVLIVDETDLQKPTCCDQMPASVAMYDYDREDWWLCELGVFHNDTFHVEITHWKYLDWPDDTYCPNLRAWLSGCPVPGLREATERYKAEQAKSLEESHKRTKDAQEAFDKCIAETKGE